MENKLRTLIIASAIFGLVMAASALFRALSPAARVRALVRSGDAMALAKALDKNPEWLNARDSDFWATPLHWAAIENKPGSAKALLAKGADANALDRHGKTPLHKAAEFGRAEIADILLRHGAEPDLLAPRYGTVLVTALDLAAEADKTNVVQTLLNHGAKLNLQKPEKKRVSALHMAAGKGNYGIAHMLLEAGADPNAKDMRNRTPLDWAEETGYEEVARLIKIFGGK